MIQEPQDTQDDTKPRNSLLETTGGHECKDKSANTLLDVTFANAPNLTEKNLVTPYTLTRFLLDHGNTFPSTSLPAYLNLTDSMLFSSSSIAFPRCFFYFHFGTLLPP